MQGRLGRHSSQPSTSGPADHSRTAMSPHQVHEQTSPFLSGREHPSSKAQPRRSWPHASLQALSTQEGARGSCKCWHRSNGEGLTAIPGGPSIRHLLGMDYGHVTLFPLLPPFILHLSSDRGSDPIHHLHVHCTDSPDRYPVVDSFLQMQSSALYGHTWQGHQKAMQKFLLQRII